MGVQFQKNGKMYYFDANGIEAQNGTFVIVDTVRGLDLGARYAVKKGLRRELVAELTGRELEELMDSPKD